MAFNQQLKEELEKLTPAWAWRCDCAGDLPLCVYATNRQNGRQTEPILISKSLWDKNAPSESAIYVVKIMARIEPEVLGSSSTKSCGFVARVASSARGFAVRWTQELKGKLAISNPVIR